MKRQFKNTIQHATCVLLHMHQCVLWKQPKIDSLLQMMNKHILRDQHELNRENHDGQRCRLRTPLRRAGFGFNVRSCVMCPELAPLAYPDFTILL